MRIASFGGGLVPAAYCHFASEFSGQKKGSFIFICYSISFVMVSLILFGLIPIRVEFLQNSFYYLRAADWRYNIVTTYFLLFTIYGYYLLLTSLQSTDEEKRIQGKMLLISTFIGFASGIAAHFLPAYGFFKHPETNIFITIYTLLPTYAIFRYKLFNIEFIFRKSLIYSLSISIMTGCVFLIVLLAEKLFQKNIGYSSIIWTIAIYTVIIIVAEPIRFKLQALIDRLIYKGSFNKIVEQRDLFQQEIQKQDRMKAVSTLAAGMAHEIKNPLTSIRTFAEYLPQKYDDPEFRSKFKKIVVEEVDRVNTIVRQLLEFSKPSELVLRRESIVSILDDTLGLLNNDLLHQNIDLVRNYESKSEFLVDKNQLKQAFLNLLLNSMQAMPHGGTLTISTRAGKDMKTLTVTVEDTGIGINKEHVPHIFDPFYTTKDGGSGLGLSIVHGIITKHGGKIKVESEPGRGTTFSVLLKSQS